MCGNLPCPTFQATTISSICITKNTKQTVFPRPITANVGIYIFFIIIVHVKPALRAVAKVYAISIHGYYLAGEQNQLEPWCATYGALHLDPSQSVVSVFLPKKQHLNTVYYGIKNSTG